MGILVEEIGGSESFSGKKSETYPYGLQIGQCTSRLNPVFSSSSSAVSLLGYSNHPPSQKSARPVIDGISRQRSR